MARVNVQIKKNTKENLENNTITIGELVIDTYKKIVYRNNIEIILTPKEYNILLILAKSEGVPISKKDLIKKMWGTTLDVNTNTIEVFINSLRNKIDKNHSFKMIQTKYGFGYFINDKNET
jgi:DNA-binding response OmpR family regulator